MLEENNKSFHKMSYVTLEMHLSLLFQTFLYVLMFIYHVINYIKKLVRNAVLKGNLLCPFFMSLDFQMQPKQTNGVRHYQHDTITINP